MYGVIIKESKGNYNPYVKKYFPSMERSFISQFFSKAQLGEIDSHQFLSALGFADTAFHMHDYIEHYITVDKGFYSFAEKFSGMYRFVVLSNDVADWSRYITEYYNLNRYFDAKIISADVHCRKPEPEIFQTALEKLGVPAEGCIFIDNSVRNLTTASSFGMETVLFNRDGEDYNGNTVCCFEELRVYLEGRL